MARVRNTEAVERSPQLQQRCSCSLHVAVPSNSRKSFTVVEICGEVLVLVNMALFFHSSHGKTLNSKAFEDKVGVVLFLPEFLSVNKCYTLNIEPI